MLCARRWRRARTDGARHAPDRTSQGTSGAGTSGAGTSGAPQRPPAAAPARVLDLPEGGRVASITVEWEEAGRGHPEQLPAAVGAAWRGLAAALGGVHASPTALLLFTSAPITPPALALLTELASAHHARLAVPGREDGPQPPPAPALIGCSSRLWSSAPAAGTQTQPAGTQTQPAGPQASPHITLAAVSLPGFRAFSFHQAADALPALPATMRDLLTTQPQLLLLASPAAQALCHAQLDRWGNLFPGGALAGAWACDWPPTPAAAAQGGTQPPPGAAPRAGRRRLLRPPQTSRPRGGLGGEGGGAPAAAAAAALPAEDPRLRFASDSDEEGEAAAQHLLICDGQVSGGGSVGAGALDVLAPGPGINKAVQGSTAARRPLTLPAGAHSGLRGLGPAAPRLPAAPVPCQLSSHAAPPAG